MIHQDLNNKYKRNSTGMMHDLKIIFLVIFIITLCCYQIYNLGNPLYQKYKPLFLNECPQNEYCNNDIYCEEYKDETPCHTIRRRFKKKTDDINIQKSPSNFKSVIIPPSTRQEKKLNANGYDLLRNDVKKLICGKNAVKIISLLNGDSNCYCKTGYIYNQNTGKCEASAYLTFSANIKHHNFEKKCESSCCKKAEKTIGGQCFDMPSGFTQCHFGWMENAFSLDASECNFAMSGWFRIPEGSQFSFKNLILEETSFENNGTLKGNIFIKQMTGFQNNDTIWGNIKIVGMTSFQNEGEIVGEIEIGRVTSFKNEGTVNGKIFFQKCTDATNTGEILGEISIGECRYSEED